MAQTRLTRVRQLVAIVLVVACRGDRGAVRSAQKSDTSAVAKAADPERPWRVVSWEPYAGVDPGDLGLGVVYLTHAEDKGATTRTDTLLLRSAPDSTSPPVGAMLFTVAANGVTQYAIAAPDSLRANLVEYGYEESGVPFDSADASGRWMRGILGFTSGGVAQVGWVDARRPGTRVIRWAEHLTDRPIFFPEPEHAAFFATADSTKRVPVPRGGDDAYAIHPMEVRGRWLHVRVVTPSDNCEPDFTGGHTQMAWIRYLDDRGRPNVWYYTRGC
jgi:hypothetical protein